MGILRVAADLAVALGWNFLPFLAMVPHLRAVSHSGLQGNGATDNSSPYNNHLVSSICGNHQVETGDYDDDIHATQTCPARSIH